MKHIFILIIIIFGQLISIAQMDTVVVFDIQSETETIIPIGPFDTISNSEYVIGNTGEWGDLLELNLERPINTPPGASFTDLVLAKNNFDLLKYPIRTNVAIVWYDTIHEQYATCSGSLIANNIVLTSGHCLGGYNVNGDFLWKRDGMHVSPSHSEGLPQPSIGKIKVEKYVILKTFFDQEHYTGKDDFGMLILEEPIGDLIGYLGYGFNNDSAFYTAPIFYSFSYPREQPEYDGYDMYYNYGSFNNISNGYVYNGISGVNGMSGSNFFYTNNEIHISYGQKTHPHLYRLNKRKDFFAIKEIDDLYNVGISENNYGSSFIKVYPNPMTDYSNIEIAKPDLNNKKLNFVLYDLYGNECKRISNIKDGLIKLKRENLRSGLYFFFIQNEIEIVGNGKILIK